MSGVVVCGGEPRKAFPCEAGWFSGPATPALRIQRSISRGRAGDGGTGSERGSGGGRASEVLSRGGEVRRVSE